LEKVEIMIDRDWNLSLTVDQVLRGQGADPEKIRARRPALVKTAEWALREGLPLLEPAVVIRELVVQSLRHEQLLLEEGGRLSGSLISQHLGGASRVAVMVCTIGSQLEAISGEMMATDPLLSLGLEGVGTAAVELLASEAISRLEAAARADGLQSSIPLSPGMINWTVEVGQPEIFALVDAGQIGVHLNGSSMMVPRMSLSQVLGFGLEMNLKGRSCDYCNLNQTCRYQNHYAPANPA
jgi:hypothetical protein